MGGKTRLPKGCPDTQWQQWEPHTPEGDPEPQRGPHPTQRPASLGTAEFVFLLLLFLKEKEDKS